MILIAESSSTRAEWVVVDRQQVVDHVFTDGINPFFQSRREISRSVRLNLPDDYFRKKFDAVYFYGAGCNSVDKSKIVEASLVAQFKTPIEVASDLLAAARGLFQDSPGIACILGTGSNSCFYDGAKIVKNVVPGGYILGDEGSGAVLGKHFLSDVLKEIAPKELIEIFYDTFRITPAMALESVYQMSFPNRFLATIAYFLSEHLDNQYVYDMVQQNLQRFFDRNISQYDYKNYPIRMMGSSAVLFRPVIADIAKKLDVEVDEIKDSVIHGLVKFHS